MNIYGRYPTYEENDFTPRELCSPFFVSPPGMIEARAAAFGWRLGYRVEEGSPMPVLWFHVGRGWMLKGKCEEFEESYERYIRRNQK